MRCMAVGSSQVARPAGAGFVVLALLAGLSFGTAWTLHSERGGQDGERVRQDEVPHQARCVMEESVDAPDNYGITLRFCASTVSPRLGDEVAFSVLATDPDAPLLPLTSCSPNLIAFGDEEGGCFTTASCAAPEDVVVPAKEPGKLVEQHRHAYTAGGTYRARVELLSGGQCSHPFASTASGGLFVTVK